MRAGALAASHAPQLQAIQRNEEGVQTPSKEFILKRLKSSPSGLLTVGQSPRWLKLDRIHQDHVAAGAAAEIEWILTPRANLLVAMVIIFQSALLGAEVSLELQAQQHGQEHMPLRWAIAFEFLDVVLLVFFSVEYVLRCHALRWAFVASFAGAIDLLLLVTGFFSAAVIAIDMVSSASSGLVLAAHAARRLRIVRIGRILALFPALSILIKGLAGTMIAIRDSMVLIGMMSFVGALICCEAFGPQLVSDPQLFELFGSVARSFYVHLQFVLVEAWPDTCAVMMEQNPFWACYVIIFLIFSNFAILNVVTGVVCDGVLELASGKPPDSREKQMWKLESMKREIREVYRLGPKDSRGQLDQNGYVTLLKSHEGLLLLDKMHIALPSTKKHLENLLDEDHNGSISLEELQQGLMRLRGSQLNLDGLSFQCRLFRNFWSSTAALEHVESNTIPKAIRKTMQLASERLEDEINGMETVFQHLEEDAECRTAQQQSQLQGVFDHVKQLEFALATLLKPVQHEEISPKVQCKGTQTEKLHDSFVPTEDWFGYFRANSVVNTGAVVEVLQFLSSRAGLIWSSRGIFMNRPALKAMAPLMRGRIGREMPKAVMDLTRLFIPNLLPGASGNIFRSVLQSGLVYAFGGDNRMSGLTEFVFAATLRARDPQLRIRWMPNQSERFIEDDLLLERFAFRLASATFGWSKNDWKHTGPKMSSTRRKHRVWKRFRKGKTKLWGNCLWKDVEKLRCHKTLLPQCILVLHPVDSAELMRDLHYIVSHTACLAGANLRGSQGVPLVRPRHTGSGPQHRASLRRNQLFTEAHHSGSSSTHRVVPQLQV
eukprot:Skav205046  [mRNA]  locus=scaffold2506:188942:196067:+ [translate_table: standard]